ncbi:MAG: glycoside hydrolase family 3 C-terminal domain-containing protein, partial [Clostridia bacterium]|nr:glycoside hydrolase family 3 C-terminal domain-containing protein [Clostridia bacterium]
MTEKQLKELLNSLTLEQKVGQLFQCAGNAFDKQGVTTGVTYLPWLTEEYTKNCGSILNIFDNIKLKNIQENHLKNNPIPLMFMADIINGYRVVFPSSIAQGCSFNPSLTEKAAKIAAFEASKHGVNVTFSPMCDVSRDARWGRISEGYGESTLLNADFAVANVKGYQGEDIGSGDNIASCVKHFAAYGASYDGRDYSAVEMSERMLQTTYLPPYEAAIKAGAKLIMPAFNTIGAIPCTANKNLLVDTLRKKWGFNGVVISDYQAVKGVHYEGAAQDEEHASKLCIEAGVDIDMVDNYYCDHLKNAVLKGDVSEETLNESVMRVLRLKNELGILDDPYKFIKKPSEEIELHSEQHEEFATDMVCQSSVLLKNENNTLPLCETEKVAFIGPFCDINELMTRWSMVTPHRDKGISIKEALEEKFGKGKFACHKGSPFMYESEYVDMWQPDKAIGMEEELLNAAIKSAKESDKVVLCLGEHQSTFGEAHSRTDIRLAQVQRKLFDEIYNVNKNIIVVLFNGRPIQLDDINDKASAILDVWFPGTYGAKAIVDMIFGKRVPSGKLSMCFPQKVGQVPIHHEVLQTNHYHKIGGKDFGYACRYIDCTNLPLYPFGFGLSYTNFEYSPIKLDKEKMQENETITATVQIKNTGDFDAYETVQLYIHDMFATYVSLPIKSLKAYKKVFIKKG